MKMELKIIAYLCKCIIYELIIFFTWISGNKLVCLTESFSGPQGTLIVTAILHWSVCGSTAPPHQSQLFGSENNMDEKLMEKTLLFLMLSTHTTPICKNMTMSNNKDENNILIWKKKKEKKERGG